MPAPITATSRSRMGSADAAFCVVSLIASNPRRMDGERSGCTNAGRQFPEKRRGILQVFAIEAFRESAVDRCKQLIGLLELALRLPQPRKARGCPQLPRFRLLLTSPIEGSQVVSLGALEIALEQ